MFLQWNSIDNKKLMLNIRSRFDILLKKKLKYIFKKKIFFLSSSTTKNDISFHRLDECIILRFKNLSHVSWFVYLLLQKYMVFLIENITLKLIMVVWSRLKKSPNTCLRRLSITEFHCRVKAYFNYIIFESSGHKIITKVKIRSGQFNFIVIFKDSSYMVTTISNFRP